MAYAVTVSIKIEAVLRHCGFFTEIAAAIDATPETLSHLIERLTAAVRIAWQGRRLRILKPPPAVGGQRRG